MSFKRTLAIGISFLVLFFIACEIGLGAAVDTQAPSISITTPATGELCKGDILVSGNLKDDKGVTKVLVTLSNIGTEKIVFENQEAVLGENSDWSLKLATSSSSEDSKKESLALLPDGSYQIEVVAYDASGHTSSKPTATFDVDTMPPLFIMDKPAVVNIDSATATGLYLFGHKVQLTGVMNDSHKVEKIELEVYDSNNNPVELYKNTFSGFDSNSTAITIASYYSDTTSLDENQRELYENYIAIYGQKDSEGWNENKTFYAVVKVYDELGNSTEKVLLNDSFDEVLKTKGLSSIPDVRECVQILQDSYTGLLTEAEIQTVKTLLTENYEATNENIKYYADSETKFAFAINSDADPVYSLVNYPYTGADDFVAASVNGSLSFSVRYGIDNAEIYPSSLKAKITLLDNELEKTETCVIADATFITDRGGNSVIDDETTVSNETYSLYLDSSFGLKAGSYYKVEITGRDTNGNELVALDDNNYGFAIKDSTNTSLTSSYYKLSDSESLSRTGSNVYVNGTTEITVYGTYANSTSGVEPLTFTLAGEEFTPSSVLYSSSEIITAEDAQAINDWAEFAGFEDDLSAIRSWKIVITPSKVGKLLVHGKNHKNIETSSIVDVSARLFEIVLDTEAPSLTLNSLSSSYYKAGESLYYVNNSKGNLFTFKGNASDSKALSSVKLEILTESEAVTSVTVPENSGNLYNWEFASLDLSSLTGGAKAKFTVTDAAGNKTSSIVNIKFDTTGPQALHWVDYKNKDIVFRIGEADNEATELTEAGLNFDSAKDSKTGSKYSSGSYGNDTAIKIRGAFVDSASGLARIYYKIFSEAPTDALIEDFRKNYLTSSDGSFAPLSSPSVKRVSYTDTDGSKKFKEVVSTYNATISGFTSVNNYLLLLAEDNVGNAAIDSLSVFYDFDGDGEYEVTGDSLWNGSSSYVINVDTQGPQITAPSTTLYSNASEDLVFTGYVTDDASGLRAGFVDVNGKTISSSDTTYGSMQFTTTGFDDEGNPYSSKYVKVTVNVKASLVFADAEDGNVTVYARAVDNAGSGNESRVSIATVVVDKTKPVLSVISPSDADSSKEAVQVNGTINIKGSASDKSGFASDGNISLYYTTNESLGKVTSLDFLTPSESASDGWKLYKEIPFANNWNFTDIVTSDIAPDGTKVYFTFAACDKAGNTGYSIPLELEVDQDTDRPVIYLSNIEDISSMTSSSTAVWLKNTNSLQFYVADDDGSLSSIYYSTDSAQTWKQVSLSNGAGSLSLEDGSHEVLFKIEDLQGTTFVTTNADSLKQPKLSDGTNVKSSALYISIDKTVPIIEDISYSYYDESKSAYQDQDKILPTMGGNRSKFILSFNAADENAIEKVKASISGIDTEYLAVLGPSVLDASSGKYYSTCTISDIEIPSTIESGTYSLKVVVTDKAGLEKEESIQIVVDNTVPEVDITSPSDSVASSGIIRADGNVSGANAVYYALSPSSTVKPDGVTKIPSWSGLDSNGNAVNKNCNAVNAENIKAPSYSLIADAGTKWGVYFDGDLDAQTGTHTNLMTDYLIDYGITNLEELNAAENQFDDLVYLYLWIKAYDEVGNVFEDCFKVIFDPQGDKPSLTINYPSSGATLGGTVKASGTVEDKVGTNIGVDSVWVQIISIGHGEDSSAGYGNLSYDEDYLVTNFEMTTKDLDYLAAKGYRVYNMRTYNPSSLSNAAWVSGSSSVEAGYSVDDYAVLASVTSGAYWTIDINSLGEFNPSASSASATNTIALKVTARDGDKKFSLAKTLIASFDADSPYVYDLSLVQYDGDRVVAAREYEPDMYVKGSWTLTGYVHDDDSLSELSVGSTLLVEDGNIKNPSSKTRWLDNSSKTDLYFEFPLETSLGVGSLSYTISATDRADSTPNTGTSEISINYDNQAPVIASYGDEGFDISSTVKQSNRWYTFSSVASEDDVDGVLQSGFAYTAFYFKRNYQNNSSSVTKLYDVLQSRSNAEFDISSLSIAELGKESSTLDNTIVSENGLYWFRKTITSQAGSPAIVMSDTSNLHVNSLLSIGGAYYLVKSVNANTVTLSENLSDSYTTAYLALAGIVDNTTPESEPSSSSDTIRADGYYLSPSYDDGDRMIESVSKKGTQWTWEANICSKNIPDGPIEIVYVVFDKAGNCTSSSVTGVVANNAPRMAGFVIASDYDDDQIAETKVRSYTAETYSASSISNISLGVSYFDPDSVSSKNQLGTSITAGSASAPVMTVRSLTQIIPEIVGGNNAIYYECNVKNGSKTISGQNQVPIIADGNFDYSVNTSSAINIQSGDLLSLGDTVTASNVRAIPFNFTFWDSTEGSKPFVDSQKAELTVYIAINMQSSSEPEAYVKPFYWKSLTENSIYDSQNASSFADLKGHIELEDDWKNSEGFDLNTSGTIYDSDPKVSGSITIEGSAYDSNLINALYLRLSGMTLGTSSAVFDTDTYYKLAQYDADSTEATKLVGSDAWESSGYKFEIIEERVDEEGHNVLWKLHWNTEKLGPAKDVEFSIIAVNRGIPSVNVSSSATAYLSMDGSTYYEAIVYNSARNSRISSTLTNKENQTSFYRMDVVPYVTKITSSLSSYNTVSSIYDRTSSGHYPVYMTFAGGTSAAATSANYNSASYEELTVTGFNLAGTSIFFKGTSNNSASLTATGTFDSESSAAKYRFTIPSGAKSGKAYVSVTRAGQEYRSLNNSNNNDSRGEYGYETLEDSSLLDTIGSVALYGNYETYKNYYNRIPNNRNNNNLTDDIVIDIWDINSKAAIPLSGKADNVEMKINPATGIIGFAFTNGNSRFNMANQESSYRQWNRSWDVMKYNAFAYDSAGNTYGSSVGGDVNTNTTYGDKYTFMSSRWGTVGNGQDSNEGGNNARHIENIGQSNAGYVNNTNAPVNNGGASTVTKTRIKSSCIATHYNSDNSADVYIAYYDSLNGELRFRLGNINGGTANYGSIRSDGTTLDTYTASANNVQIVAAASDSASRVYNLNDNSSEANRLYAEDYVSIAVTQDNVLVMVWYTGSDLYYSYFDAFKDGKINNDTVMSTYVAGRGAGRRGWSSARLLKAGAGVNCQIAVANDNSIHIAAYDGTNSDLSYIYMPGYDGDPVLATVDSYLDIGENLTIDVAQDADGYQIPYIGYWGSYPEKPRYAYLAKPEAFYNSIEVNGTNGNYYTGTWECSIVPTVSSVKDSRKMNVAVWKNSQSGTRGTLAYSTTGANRGQQNGVNSYTSSYATTTEGKCYGNGSNNGVMAYVVAPSSSEYYVETAQKRQAEE